MTDGRLEFVAYLQETRSDLLDDLAKFESGNYQMFAGGGQMSDVTAEWVANLRRRLAKIDKTIGAYKNSPPV